MNLGIETIPTESELTNQVLAAMKKGPASVKQLLDRMPDARPLAILTAFRCLFAQRRVFEKENPNPREEPDYKTQLEAAKLILAYQDGLPAQTNLNVNVPPPANDEDQDAKDREALVRSPALREAFRRRIDEAEKKAIERAEKKALPA